MENPNPTPEPMPANEPAPVAPELSQEAQSLLNYFKVVDPDRAGVGLDRVRAFYPRQGWSKIINPSKELVAAGLVTKRPVTNVKGGTAYELYTWVNA